MSKDYIMEALHDLDDDLVAETARQRVHTKKDYKKWFFPVAMAASFVLIVSAFSYIGGFELFAQNSENALSVPEDDIYYTVQNTYAYESESIESAKELPSVIITLDRWTEDGFEGTVSAYVDTDVIPIGSKVSVITDENTSDLTLSDDFTDYESLKIQTDTSNSKQIAMCVMFRMAESDAFSSLMDNCEGIYYLYADRIWPVETTQEGWRGQ